MKLSHPLAASAVLPVLLAAASVSAQPAPPTPAREIASTTGDLDGDQVAETLRLYSDGSLRVFHSDGERSDRYHQAAGQLDPFEYDPHAGSAPRLTVVDIDRRDRQRELMIMESHGDEDPAGEFSFYVYREGRLWPMLRRISTSTRYVALPHGATPTITGDGSVRIAYERCVRDVDPAHHVLGLTERVTQRYVLADGTMPRAELSENIATTRRPSRCFQAACPVVHVGTADTAVGEILRNLRGPASAQWQSLAIPASQVEGDGFVTVTLREEKREITQLDGVYLDVDGRRVEPERCATSTAPWCHEDGAHHAITPGQSLRLRFRVGEGRVLTLWALGYYQPLDASGEAR